jgi:FAD/FMN-containing dehydrogenase
MASTGTRDVQEAAHRRASLTCLELHALRPDLVTLPSQTEQFEQLSDENWSQTVWQRPACVASPACAADVSLLVKTLVKAEVPFAIRSGGHSPNRGDATIDGSGVMISMHRLNQVTYNPHSQLANIGPGALWGAVYTALDQHNVTVVGGRVMPVGVGGLTLGGGLSYLSYLHGLACDNIVSYEVTLPSVPPANQPLSPYRGRDFTQRQDMLTSQTHARWSWPTDKSLKLAKYRTRICFGRSKGEATTLVRKIHH